MFTVVKSFKINENSTIQQSAYRFPLKLCLYLALSRRYSKILVENCPFQITAPVFPLGII